jgi:hypothetical protein
MRKHAALRGALAAIIVLSMGVIPALHASSEATYVIDTPTTGMLDYGAYDLNFRLFSEGGILTRLHFGVFKMVNLGFGWEVSRAIGTQNVTVSPPSLFLKIRPYAGGMVLPAFAFGYDGQGYFYDRDRSEYLQKEKGIFLEFGREVLLPGLVLNAGANMADFKNNTVFGFLNASFTIEEKFLFLAEYDNINYLPDSRLNAGFRLFVTDDLGVDVAARDIGAGRTAERILRINYVGRF